MPQVGVHGAGLTYHNFQRPGSALVEVFPCHFHQVGSGGLMEARSHCSGPWGSNLIQACLLRLLLPVWRLPTLMCLLGLSLPHQVPQKSMRCFHLGVSGPMPCILQLTSGLPAMLQDAYFQQTSRREATVMPFQILLNNTLLCQPGAQEANADQQGEVAQPVHGPAAVRAIGKRRLSTRLWPCSFRSTQRLASLADGHLQQLSWSKAPSCAELEFVEAWVPKSLARDQDVKLDMTAVLDCFARHLALSGSSEAYLKALQEKGNFSTLVATLQPS